VNGAVVRLAGEIDLENARRMLRSIEDLEMPGEIDLTDVTYLDSAGIHLLSIARRARETGGTLRVIVPPDSPVKRLIDVAGWTRSRRSPTSF
jgi:anti-anti-sigma factor